MLKSLFGPDSLTSRLRGGLEETSATQRTIAARVSRALTASSSADFAGQLDAAGQAKLNEESLEQDMTALADTELRYEADAKLLQTQYAQFRAAIRDRA
jgi:flagellar basal body rod protein FlgB